MAAIDLSSAASGGGGGGGNLQLASGASMSSTLRAVTDTSNVASPLELSTTLVKITSTLRITTDDNPYVDAEDGSGNNRFTIGRDGSSQQVNVDFASNPTGSTTSVGAIRTYRDGTNLSEAMTFIEDGSIGVGTTAPIGLLHLYKAAATTRMVMDGDAGQSKIITYRTAGLQRFGLYVNNTAESGSNAGSDFAVRAYSDAGTLLSTALFIKRSTGNVGINTLTGTAKLQVVGSGSTSATTSFLVQNSSGTAAMTITDDGKVNANQLVFGGSNGYIGINNSPSIDTALRNIRTDFNSSVLSISTGEVGVGDVTTYPSAIFVVSSTTRGFLPPRMTNAERAAIATPAEGLNLYNTTNKGVGYYDGTNWGYLSGAKQTATGSGGTLAISFASGNIVDLTLTASTTLTFANAVIGTYIIQVTQGGTGSYTLTYPASVKWSGGTAPTLTTTVGKTDILTFYHDGTSFFGTYSLNY